MATHLRCSLRLLRRSLPSTARRVPGGRVKLHDDGTNGVNKFEGAPRILRQSMCASCPSPKDGLSEISRPKFFKDFSATPWGMKFPRPFHSSKCQSNDVGGSDSTVLEPKSSEAFACKNYKNIKAELVEGGSVGLILLDRPKALNALSEALMMEVVDACQALDGLEEVGAIVISGIGKAFAAGADIKEMKDKSFAETHRSRMFSQWNSLSAISKPIIGAVNGYALGGGCELAMLCDILLAGEKAVFGQPEVTLGVIPGIGGTQRLIREVGKSRAMEMVLTGKAFMNAEEAAQRGLISRVVLGDNEALLSEAISVAKSISDLSRPSVAMAKEAVQAAYEVGLQEGIKREHALFCAAFSLEGQKEGMAAFVDKRKPKFQHK